jgi:type VI protein secretion system component VasK
VKDAGTHHHGPLAGLGAGAAAVLFAVVVLLLAWHRVSGQVSMAITVLVWGLVLAVLFFVFLWLRHRVRHPETLAPRHAVRAEVPAAVTQAITAAPPAAIEPPRVYLNVTENQLAALMRQHAEEGSRDR